VALCARAGIGVARRRVLVSGREVRGTHPFFPSSHIRATLIVTFSTINFGIYPIYAAAFGGQFRFPPSFAPAEAAAG